MIEYYKRLKNTILQDIDAALKGSAEGRSAEKLKKALDIAADCQEKLDAELSSEWEKLSPETQAKIEAMIDEELNGKEI